MSSLINSTETLNEESVENSKANHDPVEEELENYAQHLQQEQPKLNDAIKNLISLVLGLSLTYSETDKDCADYISYSPEDALKCGKTLLKSIQSCELVEVGEWCINNPQIHDQTAVHRIDEVIKYKVVCLLRQRALKGSVSISKFFGQSYIEWTNHWPSIKQLALTSKDESLSSVVLSNFLFEFESSFMSSSSKTFTPAHENTHGIASRTHEESPAPVPSGGQAAVLRYRRELIWSRDFKSSLAEISRQRCMKIKEQSSC